MIHGWLPWTIVGLIVLATLVAAGAWWGSAIHHDNLDQLGGRTGVDLGPDFWKNIR